MLHSLFTLAAYLRRLLQNGCYVGSAMANRFLNIQKWFLQRWRMKSQITSSRIMLLAAWAFSKLLSLYHMGNSEIERTRRRAPWKSANDWRLQQTNRNYVQWSQRKVHLYEEASRSYHLGH
jgi:hypothetical protein